MLRAVGFGDGDFDKPIVGVASGHSTMNPCNAGIAPLVSRAEAALLDAGAMPQTFGFPTVSDGISMGPAGMKYSLVCARRHRRLHRDRRFESVHGWPARGGRL